MLYSGIIASLVCNQRPSQAWGGSWEEGEVLRVRSVLKMELWASVPRQLWQQRSILKSGSLDMIWRGQGHPEWFTIKDNNNNKKKTSVQLISANWNACWNTHRDAFQQMFPVGLCATDRECQHFSTAFGKRKLHATVWPLVLLRTCPANKKLWREYTLTKSLVSVRFHFPSHATPSPFSTSFHPQKT